MEKANAAAMTDNTAMATITMMSAMPLELVRGRNFIISLRS